MLISKILRLDGFDNEVTLIIQSQLVPDQGQDSQ